MYKLLRKILFTQDPEKVHYLAMRWLSRGFRFKTTRAWLTKNFAVNKKNKGVSLFGIDFPHPVGLAAGFDKDAKWVDQLSALGFAFIEIGTVTPLPQPGNEQPRLFRLPADQALINRMGFNNDGSKAAAGRLANRKTKTIIGGNIGKNKVTPNENAASDYEKAFRDLYDVVDYFVVNVSSPNTPGLRELQDKEPLLKILGRLQIVNSELGKSKPILLKIAPDLTREQLDEIVEIVEVSSIQGIVATNTTINRLGLRTSASRLDEIGAGGLSGRPVKDMSTDVIRYLHQRSQGKIPIIAVGGIFSAKDAKEKLDAGAKLVQVYTGFIYKGPGIVKKILKHL